MSTGTIAAMDQITLEHPNLGPDQRITVTRAAWEVAGGLKDSGWELISAVTTWAAADDESGDDE